MTGQDTYRVLGRLGAGGFGVVYLALHQRAEVEYERLVAIKILHPELATERLLQRFRHEAALLGRIHHAAVVKGGPPLWLTRADGGETVADRREAIPAFVMDYAPGLPLSRWTEAGEALPTGIALELVGRIAEVLHQIHHQLYEGRSLRVVHRDLKPSNLVLGRGGDIRILDLGIAKADVSFMDARQATVGLMGTPGYIAPENLARTPVDTGDPAPDVYSMGVILHELLTGRPPDAPAPPSPDNVLRQGIELAEWMRAPDPTRRPSFREVARRAEAIQRLVTGLPLAEWSEAHVPTERSTARDSLTNVVLMEAPERTASTGTLPLPINDTPVANSTLATPPPRVARPSRAGTWTSLTLACVLVASGWVVWGRSLAPTGQAEVTRPGGAADDPPISSPPVSETLHSEELASSQGRFREVVEVPGCTGTIIGPYAVITASRCGIPDHILLKGPMENSRQVSHPVTAWAVNPYLQSAFRPDEWETANLAQIAAGGRTDDWPAQHDQQVLFVPSLTPGVLLTRGILPPKIDPRATVGVASTVGIGGVPGVRRDWARTTLLPAIPGSITSGPRDFYLGRACSDTGYLCGSPGGAGGPTIGHRVFMRLSSRPGKDGSLDMMEQISETAEGTLPDAGRIMIGVTPNEVSPTPRGWVDMAPLAYWPGMTPNQEASVTVNATWAQYAASDADGDDIAYACDANPAASDPTHNRCPASVGVPRARGPGSAAGLLQCPSGYVATGVGGRSGDLVDQLSVMCRPAGCMAAGIETCTEIWTASFGGPNGDAFTSICPAGTVIIGISGRKYFTTTPDVEGWMTSARLTCGRLADVRARLKPAMEAPSSGSDRFGGEGAEAFSSSCSLGAASIGLVARTVDERFITGLQLVCSAEPAQVTAHAGGTSGKPFSLPCPEGSVAIGTIQRAYEHYVSPFGLLCADPTRLSLELGTDEQFVVHSTFVDSAADMYNDRLVRLTDYLSTTTVGSTLQRCKRGSYLSGINMRAGAYVDRIESLICVAAAGATTSIQEVAIGTLGEVPVRASCPSKKPVNGMVVFTGAWLNGLSLTCGD